MEDENAITNTDKESASNIAISGNLTGEPCLFLIWMTIFCYLNGACTSIMCFMEPMNHTFLGDAEEGLSERFLILLEISLQFH